MQESSGSDLARSTLARLRARIASGEWAIGSRIPTEPELSEMLGVGRSTVREAVRSLATLGMVETLTARGTFVRSATPTPSLLMNALSVYDDAELVGLWRAVSVEAAQSAAVHWTAGDLEAMEAALRTETALARDGAGIGGIHCVRFHGAITQASGNRLLADLDASIGAALQSSGLADRTATSLDPVSRIEAHDRILTAIRARDVPIAVHLMALHADSAITSLGRDPITAHVAALPVTPSGDAGTVR